MAYTGRVRLDQDTRRRLSRARDLLEAEDLPAIPVVARRAGVSPCHFIRLFEAAFGTTPHRYRSAARLARARRLLASGVAVTDVCLEVGFSSLGSFSDLFARRVGAPPSAYRRRTRAFVTVPGRLPAELYPGCLSLMGCLPPGAFRSFQEA